MDIVAVDTETTGFEWWGEDYAFLATVSDFEKDELYPMDKFDELRDRLERADALIFHNAAFDLHFLAKTPHFDLDELLDMDIHDTALLARIVVPSEEAKFQYGLKHLSNLLLGDESDEDEREVKRVMKKLGLVQREDQKSSPPGAYLAVYEDPEGREVLERYALKDTRLTYDLYHTLMERATDADMAGYDLERRVLPHIVRMEDHGISVDQSKAISLQREYNDRRADAHTRLARHTNREDFNPDSNDQVAEILIAAGVPLTQTTDTGQIRVDKWALERYEGHPAVDALLDLRTADKFLSTYIDPLCEVSRVHPSIWQIGARTHRMSCSNPNMQNVPVRSGTEVRALFVPGAGRAFVVCDYGQIEPRILAYYMNDPKFTDLVNEGHLYEFMGEQIYGTDDQSKWKVSRQNLKNGTLALTYGAGGPRLAATIGGGMTPDEGRDLARRIKKVLGPKYAVLTQRVKQAVETRGYIKTMYGRRLYVPRDRSYTGLNYLIQGSAAEVMKLGLANTADALEGLDAFPVLPVHDELLVECVATEAENVRDIVVESMTGVTDEFELVVSNAICHGSWAEAK